MGMGLNVLHLRRPSLDSQAPFRSLVRLGLQRSLLIQLYRLQSWTYPPNVAACVSKRSELGFARDLSFRVRSGNETVYFVFRLHIHVYA